VKFRLENERQFDRCVDQYMGNSQHAISHDQVTTAPAAQATAVRPTASGNASLNYSVAKVISIFTVAAGHWFSGTILWIPVTFGLFIFAFSSGYFTRTLYGDAVNRRHFWRKKLERLGLRYWVILAFLSVVVVLKGKTILHAHTLVHFAGLSGILNWAADSNRSGLGAGLWFFTLLLIFYIAYPGLAQVARSKWGAAVVTCAGFAGAAYLEEHVKVGHELWLTSFGFVAGVMYGAHQVRFKAGWALTAAVLSCAVLFGLNLTGYTALNTVLIIATSLMIALWLARAALPQWTVLQAVAKLERYLLEIFLIHTYLFLHLTGNSGLDFIVSLAVILAASVAVNLAAGRVSSFALDRKIRRS